MSSTSIYILPGDQGQPLPNAVYGSLNADDRSRFRPFSSAEPRDIELMQGTFTLPGAQDIATPQSRPTQSAHGWFMSG